MNPPEEVSTLIAVLKREHDELKELLSFVKSKIVPGSDIESLKCGLQLLRDSMICHLLKEDFELFPVLSFNIKKNSSLELFQDKTDAPYFATQQGESKENLYYDTQIFSSISKIFIEIISDAQTLLTQGKLHDLHNKLEILEKLINDRISYEEAHLFSMFS